jgi:hypothetical protein
MYRDWLMNAGHANDWATYGVGVLCPGDAGMKQVMDSQDHLYTLVVNSRPCIVPFPLP